MIEVSFHFPSEIDLAFYYLDRQFQRFVDEGVPLPQHEVLIGEDEVSILMWYPDDDEDGDGGDGGDGNDPIWPIGEPPQPELGYSILGYLPEWTADNT